jgi:hypothetical protein
VAAEPADADGPVTERLRQARKVYVETSVWGMVLENQPRALRQPTLRFLRQCHSGLFLPYVSSLVLQEIGRAKALAKARMLREIKRLAIMSLEPTEASSELAAAYLRAGVIPAKKRNDALHVAIATVAGLAPPC